MKFKNNLFYILSFGMLISSISCTKILDQEPVSLVASDAFWKNNTDAALGVAAIYDNMQKTYRQKHFLWGELRADNYIRTNTSAAYAINLVNNSITPSNTDQATIRWDELYAMINTANIAIERIPGIPLFDGNLLGEAYALRAYAYFDAVRVWGAAPMYTKPTLGYSEDKVLAKTDGATIMNQVVLPDMLEAEKLLTQRTSRFRFSKSSVYIFQANVYFYLKQYDKAKEALDKFFALNTTMGNVFKLATTRDEWVNHFIQDPVKGETGPELIFSLKYNVLEDGNRASGVWETFNAGAPQIYLSPLLENKWIAKFPTTQAEWEAKYPGFTPKSIDPVTNQPLYGDWRYFESREAGVELGRARIAKYRKGILTSTPLADDGTDIIIYRYAGVLLFRALLENKLSFANKQIAVDLINQVRTARQLPTVKVTDFTAQDQLENFILDERQLELLAEGQRWWDLIYTDKAVQVMGPINGQTATKLLFPIYFKHLVDNPKLVQTPGY